MQAELEQLGLDGEGLDADLDSLYSAYDDAWWEYWEWHDKAKELREALKDVELRDAQRYLLREECAEKLGPFYLTCKDHHEGDEGMHMSSRTSSGKTSESAASGPSAPGSEPGLVSGHQYHGYSNSDTRGGDRYVYAGKDDGGTPEFIDYGPKGGRSR